MDKYQPKKKTVNALASLYFVRHKENPDQYWYIISQSGACQEIGQKQGYQEAGLWTIAEANRFIEEYGLQEEWEAVAVPEVVGNLDGSIN